MIDAHCHLDPELSLDELLRIMDRDGVERAALIPAANMPVGAVPRFGPPVFHACMRVHVLRAPMYRAARARMTPVAEPDNGAVFSAAAASPSRFLPFAFVNPGARDPVEELERWIERGARGLKLHAWLHDFRLPDALPLLQRAARAGLPVLAHLGFGARDDVAYVLERAPGLKLILAHAGIPLFERAWHLPVWFDVAARELASDGMVARLVRAVDPARVIYGSDAPVGIRVRTGGYAYPQRSIPERALGANLEALLE